jgi:hypothetical protein
VAVRLKGQSINLVNGSFAVCFENHVSRTNTLCGEDAVSLNV